MARCEDYPCCGHTDGLPCDWKPPTEYPHVGCDHEAGYCQVWEEENDDSESESNPDNFCEVCGYPLEVSADEPYRWVHVFKDDSHKPIYLVEDID